MNNTDTDATNNSTIAIIFGTVILVWLLVLVYRGGGMMIMGWWR